MKNAIPVPKVNSDILTIKKRIEGFEDAIAESNSKLDKLVKQKVQTENAITELRDEVNKYQGALIALRQVDQGLDLNGNKIKE